jgi:tetratricopeptide (TPR) repeat protein
MSQVNNIYSQTQACFARWLVALCWLASLTLISAASTPLPTAEINLIKLPWFEIRTPTFRTFSCGKTQEVMNLVGRLEQFRYFYSTLAGTQAMVYQPVWVYAFPDDASFTPFKPRKDGRILSVGGYFNQFSDANVIALPLGRGDDHKLETIYHEYNHYLLRQNARFWPVWLEEGMADVYSTFEVTAGQVVIGKTPSQRVEILSEQKMLPLAQFLKVDRQSSHYTQREHQGLFYSQSWLLVHYLALGDNAQHRARFGLYTQQLRAGKDSVEAFTNVFSCTLAGMERQLEGYLARGKFEPTRIPIGARLAAPQALYMRAVPLAEVAYLLGRLVMPIHDEDRAASYFEFAKKLQPQSPFGYEGAGLLASTRNQAVLARANLEQAIRLGAKSHMTYFLMANLKLRATAQADGDFVRMAPEVVTEIRTLLNKSITAMPGFAPAHHRLGLVELIQEDNFMAAEKHLLQATRIEPDSDSYAMTLAAYYFDRKQFGQARPLLEMLARTGQDADIKNEAKKLLRKVDDER